ncbi:MAG: hypothetical protein KC516_04230 [Nanoarchaeota archaeon]|nr:hypothetical protein [Nanoarchaeota archaeon]
MKITEFGEKEWNKFFIPIERETNETDEKYISKLNKILDKFYDKNSKFPEWKEFKSYHIETLEHQEQNFANMMLKIDCDVKYSASREKHFNDLPGIIIWTHMDYPGLRIPKIEYLKKEWKELEID